MGPSDFFRVKVESILPSVPLPFDLYVFINKSYILYVRQGDRLERSKIESLSRRDSSGSFFIKTEQRTAYSGFINDMIQSENLEVEQKANLIRESSMSLVEEFFETNNNALVLENSRTLVSNLMGFLDESPQGMSYLLSLSCHDFYTYNHSLNVSIYALGLGKVIGLEGNTLEELTLGGLLHDIGKRCVPIEILCKRGPLNREEWELMQQHPVFGLSILQEDERMPDGVKAACLEHHENLKGDGYPQQLAGEQIHPFARAIAIVDTFDAITTQRSYNMPLTPVDALELMNKKLAPRFDLEMLKAWTSTAGNLKYQNGAPIFKSASPD